MSVVISVSAFAKNKVVYVGTNAEFAPFEYLEKNKVVGFDIEFIRRYFKRNWFRIQSARYGI